MPKKVKRKKGRVIWGIISRDPNGHEVAWGNWDSRWEARMVCKNDNAMKDRVGRVVKFVECLTG